MEAYLRRLMNRKDNKDVVIVLLGGTEDSGYILGKILSVAPDLVMVEGCYDDHPDLYKYAIHPEKILFVCE